MRQHVRKDKSVDGVWTGYLNSMERTVLKKDKFLEGLVEVAPGPVVAAPGVKKQETGSPFADKLKQAIR